MQLIRLLIATSIFSLSSAKSDRDEALELHNRARHEVSSKLEHMAWDDALARDADAYAIKLANDDAGLVHAQDRNGAGENLAQVMHEKNPMARSTQMWIDEKKDYRCSMKIGQVPLGPIGHYTQVIWPKSTKLGMAVRTSRSGKQYVVARYKNPGNYMGQSAC